MVILKLRCGLGNQFFEYACARAVMHELGENRIYLDIYEFDNEPDKRKPSLLKFDLPKDTVVSRGILSRIRFSFYKIVSKILNKITCEKTKKKVLLKLGVVEENFDYINISGLKKGNIYLQGIFQNNNYFKSIEDEIKTIYRNFPIGYNGKIVELQKKIKEENSVCVHIRRGDYANDPKWRSQLLVCNNEYYEMAMNYIAMQVDKPMFYVFSNTKEDIKWIKDNYSFSQNVYYMDMENSDIEDLALMSSCKHFILSNSSFSWWSQFLGSNSNSIVVAPEYWDTKKNAYEGIYLKNWKVIGIQ